MWSNLVDFLTLTGQRCRFQIFLLFVEICYFEICRIVLLFSSLLFFFCFIRLRSNLFVVVSFLFGSVCSQTLIKDFVSFDGVHGARDFFVVQG